MTLQLHDGLLLCDRYALLHKLGVQDPPAETASGTNSGIWLAQDQESGDRVAIRILPELDASDAAAIREAEEIFVHGLVHPNIIRTLAVDRHADGTGILVTPYLHRAEPFATRDRKAALGILMPVLDALEYAHSLGLAHGNLSSAMILVDNSRIPHLLSFGFGEHTPGWDATSYHLSPQVRSGARPQPVDDIYSLGAILFEVFTAHPWQGQWQVVDANSPMPESIQILISKMLSDSSYERPEAVSEIRASLELYLNPESEQKSGRIEETQFHKSDSPTARPDAATPGFVQGSSREKRTISATAAISMFLVLIVLIGGVFFYLPSKVSQVSTTSIGTNPATTPETWPVAAGSVSPDPEATPAPFELAQLEHFREEANAITAKILREQITLEDSGALLWATDEMQTVQNLADAGDLLFRDKDFEASIDKYQQGLTILDTLKTSIPDVLAEYLAAGKDALESGDAETAINAFTIVLSITPDDADAETSLARAQTLEQVLQLLETAGELEDAEQLQEALAGYRQARGIDPLWPASVEGVRRVSGKITHRKFNQAMSRGFNQLKQRNFDAAREAFSQAQVLIPDSKLPADGLLQVDLAFRLQKIEQHKTQAEQFAQQENWSGAFTEYQKALDLDSNLVFAIKGLEHASERLQMADNLQKYIDAPLSLNDSEALKDAKQLLYQASMVSDPGTVLATQITTLSEHIKLARVPVEVELQSDKLTDIVVYKVGHLGKLKSTRLELYPGVYTVVGKRKGYRDVRKQITLLAGQNTAPVFVQCSEKI